MFDLGNAVRYGSRVRVVVATRHLLLMILDIGWCQMHTTLSLGGKHHKSEEGNQGRNILVRYFFRYVWFFGYLSVGAECTYIMMNTLTHVKGRPLGNAAPLAVSIFLSSRMCVETSGQCRPTVLSLLCCRSS